MRGTDRFAQAETIIHRQRTHALTHKDTKACMTCTRMYILFDFVLRLQLLALCDTALVKLELKRGHIRMEE